jgi:hypothetical protein
MQTTTTTIIEGREFTVEVDFSDDAEGHFETTLSSYREIKLHGVRGALYTSERWLGTDLFRFWSESSSRRSRLPSQAFKDATWFTLSGGLLAEATYAEVKAGFADQEAYRAL